MTDSSSILSGLVCTWNPHARAQSHLASVTQSRNDISSKTFFKLGWEQRSRVWHHLLSKAVVIHAHVHLGVSNTCVDVAKPLWENLIQHCCQCTQHVHVKQFRFVEQSAKQVSSTVTFSWHSKHSVELGISFFLHTLRDVDLLWDYTSRCTSSAWYWP